MNQTRRTWMLSLLGGSLLAPVTAAAQGVRRRARAARNAPPIPNNDGERRALQVLADIRRNQRHFNISQENGRLLRVLAEAIGAKHVVEIGTSTAYSGVWLALALRGTGGRLTTFEIDPARAAIARANFKRSGLDDIATVVTGDAHQQIVSLKGPLDLVFIDADKSGYPDYLRKLAPLVRPGGLIIADNMNFPRPDPRYVAAVTSDRGLETVFLNMHGSGLGVTLKKR